MYFWNLTKLKNELRGGPLGQRAARSYLFALIIVYYAAFMMERSSPPPPAMTATDWESTLIAFVSCILGIVFAYRANGGEGGIDFMGRYVALGWVIWMRLAAVVTIGCLVAAVVLTIAVKSAEVRHEYIQFLGLLLVMGISLFYPLWLVTSIRDVARAEARE
jgi:hypothetical protein